MPETKTPNIPLLRKMVEWVEAQEILGFSDGREWSQFSWIGSNNITRFLHEAAGGNTDDFCRTTYCIAGKIAIEDGWVPKRDIHGNLPLRGEVIKNGHTSSVRIVAKVLLDITESQANALFFAGNKAQDIRRIAEAIAGERL